MTTPNEFETNKIAQPADRIPRKPWTAPKIEVAAAKYAEHGAPPGVNDGIGFFMPAS